MLVFLEVQGDRGGDDGDLWLHSGFAGQEAMTTEKKNNRLCFHAFSYPRLICWLLFYVNNMYMSWVVNTKYGSLVNFMFVSRCISNKWIIWIVQWKNVWTQLTLRALTDFWHCVPMMFALEYFHMFDAKTSKTFEPVSLTHLKVCVRGLHWDWVPPVPRDPTQISRERAVWTLLSTGNTAKKKHSGMATECQ